MGRYTTVQTYTDQDAKVAAIAYTSAVGGGDGVAQEVALGGAGSEAPLAVKRGEEDATKSSEDRYHSNRVDNVSGSSAGAGSGDFHMYRAARRRELDRVEGMEKAYAKKKETEEYEAKRKRTLDEFDARAAKRAEKRRRRKERAKAKTLDEPLSEDDDDDNDHDNKDENQRKKVKSAGPGDAEKPTSEQVLPEMPGGVPEIPNDGSFLARMLAQQQQTTASPSKT